MKLIDQLIDQCREPKGILGNIMIKIMDVADEGFTNWAISQMDDTAGNILDIGCGGGKAVYALSKAFLNAKISGIDYSEEAVKMAISKNRKNIRQGKVEILKASVLSIPYCNNYFNRITAIRTHYFWPSLKQSIQEVYRVLNKNGQFLILSELYKISYHMSEYNTADELIRLLYDIGFLSVKVYEKKGCICVLAAK